MFLSLHDISQDRFLAQCPARFQTVETVHQDQTIAVAPHQDRSFLSTLQHAFGDLAHHLRIERRTTFDRNVDICDFECLAPHHDLDRSRQIVLTSMRIVTHYLNFQKRRLAGLLAPTRTVKQPKVTKEPKAQKIGARPAPRLCAKKNNDTSFACGLSSAAHSDGGFPIGRGMITCMRNLHGVWRAEGDFREIMDRRGGIRS
jgi:hypothetical protein